MRGTDAAGKDGTVKDVLSGSHPQWSSSSTPEERLGSPEKRWKWSDNDLRERWDDDQQAYEDAPRATSTPWAPRRVIPADRRWYRDYVAARILAGTLRARDPRFPPPREEVTVGVRRELERSGPAGAPR